MKYIEFDNPVKTHVDCVFDDNGNKLSDLLGNGGGNASAIMRKMDAENMPVVCPEDFGGSDEDSIIAANEFILKIGGNCCFYLGKTAGATYEMSKAIVLPSNCVLFIDNCTLKKKNVEVPLQVDNVIRSANIELYNDDLTNEAHHFGFAKNADNPYFVKNIKVIGNGDARIELCDNTSVTTANNCGWRGSTLLFDYVDGFEIAGIKVDKCLTWGLTVKNSCNGSIHDIDFNTFIRDNGVVRQNADGIDLTACKDVDIYNITGKTGDDTICIGTLGPERLNKRPTEKLVNSFKYDKVPFGGCYNIRVNNVHCCSECNVIALLASEYEVHNITIADISDKDSRYSNENSNSSSTIKLYGAGNYNYNGGYEHGMMHDIFIHNIENTNRKIATLWLCDSVIKNGIVNCIKTAEGKTAVLFAEGKDHTGDYRMRIENKVTIKTNTQA